MANIGLYHVDADCGDHSRRSIVLTLLFKTERFAEWIATVSLQVNFLSIGVVTSLIIENGQEFVFVRVDVRTLAVTVR